MGIKWSQEQIKELNRARKKFYDKLKRKGKRIPSVRLKGATFEDKKRFKKSFELSRKTAEEKQREEIEINRKIQEAKCLNQKVVNKI